MHFIVHVNFKVRVSDAVHVLTPSASSTPEPVGLRPLSAPSAIVSTFGGLNIGCVSDASDAVRTCTSPTKARASLQSLSAIGRSHLNGAPRDLGDGTSHNLEAELLSSARIRTYSPCSWLGLSPPRLPPLLVGHGTVAHRTFFLQHLFSGAN